MKDLEKVIATLEEDKHTQQIPLGTLRKIYREFAALNPCNNFYCDITKKQTFENFQEFLEKHNFSLRKLFSYEKLSNQK